MKRDQIHTFKLFKESVNSIEDHYQNIVKLRKEADLSERDFYQYKEKILTSLKNVLDKIPEVDNLYDYLNQWKVPDTNYGYGGKLSQIDFGDSYITSIRRYGDSWEIEDENGVENNLGDCGPFVLYKILKLLLSVPHINGLVNSEIFQNINESVDSLLPRDKSQLSFILSNILEALYKKHGIKDFYKYLNNNREGVDNDVGNNAYDFLYDLEYTKEEEWGIEFNGFQREIIAGEYQWKLRPVARTRKSRVSSSHYHRKITISGGNGNDFILLTEPNLATMIKLFLKIPIITKAINLDFYKDINESFKIDDFEKYKKHKIGYREGKQELRRKFREGKEKLNKSKKKEKKGLNIHKDKLFFMLTSILDSAKKMFGTDEVMEYLITNHNNIMTEVFDSWSIFNDVEVWDYVYKHEDRWMAGSEDVEKYDYVQLDSISANKMYGFIQRLLKIPVIVKSINIDLFKDINESFRIDDLEKDLKKLKKKENKRLKYIHKYDDKISRVESKIKDRHHAKLLFMAQNILEALHQKYDVIDVLDWLDDNDFAEYEKYEKAYYKIENFTEKLIREYGKWVVIYYLEEDTIPTSIEHLSTKNLYIMVKALLTLPKVLEAINIDLFKSINEF